MTSNLQQVLTLSISVVGSSNIVLSDVVLSSAVLANVTCLTSNASWTRRDKLTRYMTCLKPANTYIWLLKNRSFTRVQSTSYLACIKSLLCTDACHTFEVYV